MNIKIPWLVKRSTSDDIADHRVCVKCVTGLRDLEARSLLLSPDFLMRGADLKIGYIFRGVVLVLVLVLVYVLEYIR